MTIFYDFEQKDAEDHWARDASGVISDPVQRRGLWYSLMLILVALSALQVLEKSILGDVFLLVAALITYPFVFTDGLGIEQPSPGAVRGYARLLRSAADQFVWRRLMSMSSVFGALTLVLVAPKRRYLPLRIPASIFATTFVVLLGLDTLPVAALRKLPWVGQQLARLSSDFSLDPFMAAALDAGHAPGHRSVAVLLAAITLLLIHLLFLVLASWTCAAVATALAWPLAPVIELDRSVVPACAHLSDLHFTQDGEDPIEPTSVTNAQLARTLRDSVHEETRALVVSGDITDSGGREEWRMFFRAIESAEWWGRVPVILAPGNHDLFPYMRSFAPRFASIPLPSRVVRIRKIRYLAAVLRICPEMSVHVDGRERSLREHLAPQASLLQACVRGEATDLHKVDALWESCFPMHCVVGLQAFVCLDTNRPTSNVTTSAFGEVSSPQAKRAAQVLDRLYDRPRLGVALVGHHHMFTPFVSRFRDWRSKYLEIVSGRSVFAQATYGADYYLHGHRHVPFAFRRDRLKVVSAPSPRFPEHGAR